jgi:hypothetical protein
MPQLLKFRESTGKSGSVELGFQSEVIQLLGGTTDFQFHKGENAGDEMIRLRSDTLGR